MLAWLMKQGMLWSRRGAWGAEGSVVRAGEDAGVRAGAHTGWVGRQAATWRARLPPAQGADLLPSARSHPAPTLLPSAHPT